MTDGEKYPLTPISGKRTIDSNLTSSLPLNGGGSEPKNRVTVSVGNRDIPLIERSNPKAADGYIRAWQLYKDAGLPVIKTLRRTEQGTIVMTDLKADGSELFGKGLLIQLRDRQYLDDFKRNTKLDSVFLNLTDESQLEDIIKMVAELSNIASHSNLLIPRDDPFELLIHPNNNWELIMLDLRGLPNPTHLDLETITILNEKSAETFIETLRKLRIYLTQTV